ncbi:MAG TPA: RidA family protein [Candidatus Acidoferrales bacterium]|nr:RidA family protein [Candidatus Acidoferrales bacterium]
MRLLIAGLALLYCAMAAERRPIAPETFKPNGPYIPGILTQDFLYVSGQGAENRQGQIPPTLEGQLRQCFENVKAVVVAAGLTMDHVVYSQVYLTGLTDEGPLNRVWQEYFPKDPPARSTIGVALLPGTPVEMSAVAVRELSRKKTVAPPGYPANSPVSALVIAGDRVYLSGFLGRDINTGRIPDDPAAQVELSLEGMQAALKAAGLDFRHMVFVNPYLTGKIPMDVMNHAYAKRFEFGNTPARATLQVAGLPSGANIGFTGVAVMDLAKRRAVRPKNMDPSPTASPCVFAADTLFCSAKSGFIPGVNGGIYAGTVETQLRQTMRNLLDGLEEAGMKFSNVVASNVYLDNLDEFAQMDGVYAEYFPSAPPTRTAVQQLASGKRQAGAKGHWPTLEQISLIAVR